MVVTVYHANALFALHFMEAAVRTLHTFSALSKGSQPPLLAGMRRMAYALRMLSYIMANWRLYHARYLAN